MISWRLFKLHVSTRMKYMIAAVALIKINKASILVLWQDPVVTGGWACVEAKQ